MTNKSNRFFKSDNYSGIYPKIYEYLGRFNSGHSLAYGDDEVTKKAIELIKNQTAENIKVVFTLNGTGTNVLAIKLMCKQFESVICADSSHININESGAPESVAGIKLITITNILGKITPEQIKQVYLKQLNNGKHAPIPKAVSITQCTEYGTVYTIAELSKIRNVCDELNLYLHIDACRIYNAAIALNTSLSEITRFADVISLGGSKLGCMLAESLIVFNPNLFYGLENLQKNTLQLYSKNRFLACQYIALFENCLWRELANIQNNLAKELERELIKTGLTITHPVETNHIFAQTTKELAETLEKANYCYIWTKDPYSIRLVTSFDNTSEDVYDLIKFIKDLDYLTESFKNLI
jgi:threonine aldolase